jgi:hypothetical protein
MSTAISQAIDSAEALETEKSDAAIESRMVRYRSGEEILSGDRVALHGNPTQIEFYCQQFERTAVGVSRLGSDDF